MDTTFNYAIRYRHEEIHGTWIGATEKSSAKLIYNPDGTWEDYLIDLSVEPSYRGTFTIIDKWNDSEGDILYKVIFKIGHVVEYKLTKISSNGSIMETVLFGIDYPTEIDPNHSRYYIHHRQ
jgi:hypothetical protein